MSAERIAEIREDARQRIVQAAIRCEEELGLADSAQARGEVKAAASHRALAELDSSIAFLNGRLA